MLSPHLVEPMDDVWWDDDDDDDAADEVDEVDDPKPCMRPEVDPKPVRVFVIGDPVFDDPNPAIYKVDAQSSTENHQNTMQAHRR